MEQSLIGVEKSGITCPRIYFQNIMLIAPTVYVQGADDKLGQFLDQGT